MFRASLAVVIHYPKKAKPVLGDLFAAVQLREPIPSGVLQMINNDRPFIRDGGSDCGFLAIVASCLRARMATGTTSEFRTKLNRLPDAYKAIIGPAVDKEHPPLACLSRFPECADKERLKQFTQKSVNGSSEGPDAYEIFAKMTNGVPQEEKNTLISAIMQERIQGMEWASMADGWMSDKPCDGWSEEYGHAAILREAFENVKPAKRVILGAQREAKPGGWDMFELRDLCMDFPIPADRQQLSASYLAAVCKRGPSWVRVNINDGAVSQCNLPTELYNGMCDFADRYSGPAEERSKRNVIQLTKLYNEKTEGNWHQAMVLCGSFLFRANVELLAAPAPAPAPAPVPAAAGGSKSSPRKRKAPAPAAAAAMASAAPAPAPAVDRVEPVAKRQKRIVIEDESDEIASPAPVAAAPAPEKKASASTKDKSAAPVAAAAPAPQPVEEKAVHPTAPMATKGKTVTPVPAAAAAVSRPAPVAAAPAVQTGPLARPDKVPNTEDADDDRVTSHNMSQHIAELFGLTSTSPVAVFNRQYILDAINIARKYERMERAEAKAKKQLELAAK